jgi:hypothetical protein
MKNQLLKLIQMAIDLLIDCGWEDKAKWFSDLKKSIENTDQCAKEFNKYLNEIDNVLSGMGSFSDLPLKDRTGRKSEQDIRNLQWELVEKIGDAIEKLRES